MIRRIRKWLENRVAAWREAEDRAAVLHIRERADEIAAERIEREKRHDA